MNSSLSTTSPYAYTQAAPLLAPTGLITTAVSPWQVRPFLEQCQRRCLGGGYPTLAGRAGRLDDPRCKRPGYGIQRYLRPDRRYDVFLPGAGGQPGRWGRAGSDYASGSAATLLYPPNLYASSISQTEIDLYWINFSAHATGFELQRSPDGLTGWTTIAAVPLSVTRVAEPRSHRKHLLLPPAGGWLAGKLRLHPRPRPHHLTLRHITPR